MFRYVVVSGTSKLGSHTGLLEAQLPFSASIGVALPTGYTSHT